MSSVHVNKVEFGGKTLIDLTDDTVTPGTLIKGATAHAADGSRITGETEAALVFDNAGSHNSIYRGKSLGTAVTTAQYQAISAGTFQDLYIGDYWTIGGVNYRIAAFDYFYQTGDTACTKHHAVVVPDTNLYDSVMNSTNTTAGGYLGSAMYQSNLAKAKTTIKAAFSGHIVSYREYLTNTVTNGVPTSGAWTDSEADLMTEQMVYGSGIFSPVSDGSTIPANFRVSNAQLPLFAFDHAMAANQQNYWLRDVVSAANFAYVSFAGNARYARASASLGVRPAFCIG